MYEYKCTVDRIIDGDTIDVWIDLGFKIKIHKRIRLFGINAPETRTKDLDEKERGMAAKNYLISIIDHVDGEVIIQTKKDDTGKYGRILGTLFVAGTNQNLKMITIGLAKPYMV